MYAEMKNKNQLYLQAVGVFFLLSSTDDHSRVMLSHLDGHLCSDYINASYIDVSLMLLMRMIEPLTNYH